MVNLSSLALSTESLCYTILINAPPQVQPIFVTATYRITGLHFTYACIASSAAYVC